MWANEKPSILAGLMAAMICLATTFLHINVGAGGYIRLGDTIVCFAAAAINTGCGVAYIAAAVGLDRLDLKKRLQKF